MNWVFNLLFRRCKVKEYNTVLDMEELYEQLKIDEGVVYEIYEDHLGYPTFGVGHLILDTDEEYGKPSGTPVSEDRVRECFERDITIAIEECKILYGSVFWDGLQGEVKSILVNMMFNLGRPRLSKFLKFKAALLDGNYRKAANEGRDSLWYRQVTNRAERLMKRLENV